MECRLYAASEWILQCGDVVFLDMCCNEELKESLTSSLNTGPLCSDTPPLSIRRREVWQRKFLEIGVSRKGLELDDATCGRILDNLLHIELVQERNSH